MKKRATALFALAVGLLVGASVTAPVSISIVRANEGNAPVAVAKYDIHVHAIEGIVVEVAESAEAGAVVQAVVTSTANNIQSIDGLLVDGLAASKTGDGVFKFVMPGHAVELVPQYTEVEAVGQYAIKHNEGHGMKVKVQERANEGEEVTFAITFNAYSGYAWNGFIDVFTINNDGEKVKEIEYDSLGDVLFAFEMPASDVFIEVGMEARTFSLTKFVTDENHDVLETYGNMYVIEKGEEETRTLIAGQANTFARAEVGSLIRVELHDTEKYKVAGLIIPEVDQELVLDEKGYVEFTLPACNISLVVNCETRYYEIDVTNSEHISLEVYHKVVDGEEVTFVLDENEKPLAQYKETIYVKAVSNDASYGVKSIHYKAMVGEQVAFDRDLNLGYDGYYVFTSNGVMTSQTLVVSEVTALADDAIDITTSDHLTAVIKVQDGDDFVAIDENHKVFPNNKVYFDFVSSDPLIGLKNAQVKYQIDGNQSLYSLTTNIDNVTGLRYVTLPEDAVKLIVVLSEQPYFDSYGFTGSYVGKFISTYGSTISNNAYLNTITPWGTGLTTNSYGFGIRTVSPDETDPTMGTFTYRKASGVGIYRDGQYLPPENQDSFAIDHGYVGSYSSHFVVFSDKTSGAISAGSSEIYVAVKKNELLTSSLEVKYDTFVDREDNRWYILTSGYEGEVDGVLAMNFTQGVVYNDTVDIEFVSGESIEDADAVYTITYGGQTLLELCKVDGHSVELDGYRGTYNAGEEMLLALDGLGNVSYGDIEAAYSIDQLAEEPTIHFSHSEVVEDTYVTTNYQAVLDMDEGTAVVTSEQNVKQIAQPTITYSDSNPFIYDDEKGTYTSGNKGLGNSTSYMYIECTQDGVLSFDYVAGGEGSFDYATVKNNSNEVLSIKGQGSTEYNLSGHIDIEVSAGDIITVCYQKDESGNRGIDSIVISNLLYCVNGSNID